MKNVIWVVFVLLLSKSMIAQTPEDSVKSVVNQLFDAMRNANGTVLMNCFTDSAILQTIIQPSDKSARVRTEAITEFADFVSKEAKGNADERISFDAVKIDGPLAMAWTPYKFYYKGAFSHCGVNSFQLVRTAEGWKIQYIIDTRRREGCE